MRCAAGHSTWTCLDKAWDHAGLGGIGGLFFPWGSALGPHPYADGAGGYALPALDEKGVRGQQTRLPLEGDGGYVLAGAGRMALGARVELPYAFLDLTTRYSLFFEPPCRRGEA